MSLIPPGATQVARAQEGFVSRDPRFKIETPVVFHFAQDRAEGRTVNLSESGLLAVLDRKLDVWVDGRLSFTAGDTQIDIAARVARADGPMAGFAFHNLSEPQRSAIRKFLEESNAPLH